MNPESFSLSLLRLYSNSFELGILKAIVTHIQKLLPRGSRFSKLFAGSHSCPVLYLVDVDRGRIGVSRVVQLLELKGSEAFHTLL